MLTSLVCVIGMEIVSLKDARERGLSRYFTGMACKRGHFSERSTAKRGCIECGLDWEKNWRQTNPNAARAKDKKQRANHAAQNREYNKKYRIERGEELRAKERHIYAENRDRFREKSRTYFSKNREAVIEKLRQRYEKNPQQFVAYTRRWQKAHPEVVRAGHQNRRARKQAAVGTHTKGDIADILRMQRGRCAYCKRKVRDDYHVDHIVALAIGGSNDRKNLQVLCPPCNMKKGAKHPVVFSQSIGLLL